MRYYDAYRNIATSPDEEYTDDLQAMSDEQFFNAPNVYNIEQEMTFGTNDWKQTYARISSVVSSKTDEKLENDYKEFTFQKLNHKRGLGYKFKLNGDIYLTIDVDSLSIVPSVIVRKCNNTLHIQTNVTKTITGYDAMNRPIETKIPVYSDFPCIVETKVNSVSVNDYSALNLPIGRILISIPYSSLIEEDVEFTIYDRVYKIIGFDFTKVINNSEGILGIFADRKV